MSGGSFSYAYSSTSHFADELEEKLNDPTEPDNRPEVDARLRQLVAEARRVSALMREAEWLYSGDTGDDTFLRRVAQIEAKQVDASGRPTP